MVDRDQTPRRYDLLERIAVGGMAEVFRAKAHGAHGFEKVLAIKRILPDLARDPEFEARFIAEAKLAVSLAHANIVQIFDFGRFAGSLCIAMEYVDGPDLGRLMGAAAAQSERVPLRAAMYIAIELCKGLEVAHARRVVHSDISPSNVLLSRAGEVKVADFGIAGAAAERRDRIMGKWPYMSPEQTRGEPLEARSDLFSAAVVLYELFTGTKLFSGSSAEEVARAVRDMPIPPPSSRRPDLPVALDEVLLRPLARDAAQRTGSAGELGRALVELSYAHTVVATEFDVADVVARWFPPPPSEAQAVGVDADALIRAQLAAAGVPSPDGDRPGTGRVTISASSSDGAAAGGAVAPTRVTLVRGAVGADGVPEFELTVAPEIPTSGAVVGRRRRWIALAGLALVAVAGAVALRRPTHVPPASAELRIESVPAAAEVSIDGAVWPQRTPATITVGGTADGRSRHVRLRLAGFRDWEEDTVLRPGERVLFRPQLQPRAARLSVQSDPPGAEVLLDGRSIGRTPVVAASVAADDRDHGVVLRHHGYADARAPVHLADGQDVLIDRKLTPAARFGTIDLHTDPWSLVYLDGRKVAEAPVKGLSLPVGRHRLQLVNPVLHRKATVTVDVPASQPYRVHLQ